MLPNNKTNLKCLCVGTNMAVYVPVPIHRVYDGECAQPCPPRYSCSLSSCHQITVQVSYDIKNIEILLLGSLVYFAPQS